MTNEEEFITVYRTADPTARADAAEVLERLREQGFDAVLAGDDTPGVVVGSFEIRVPVAEQQRAEEFLGTLTSAELREEDEEEIPEEGRSHDLDLVTIFSSQNHDAEIEAISIKSILEANDIPAFLVGASQIPSLPFEVQVPKSRAEEAMQVLEEARQAGAAEEE